MTATDASDTLQVLVFEAAGRRYALPARDVREIVRAVTVVPLPGAPPIVEGAINLRGRVLPVLDLRARFGLPPQAVDPADHMIVAQADTRAAVIRADRAVALLALAPEQIESGEQVAPGVAYVAAVAKLPDGLAVIHDLRTFLTDAEAAALDRALSAPAVEQAP